MGATTTESALCAIVRGALSNGSWLLSEEEQLRLAAFLDLPSKPRNLVARLVSRRRDSVRLDAMKDEEHQTLFRLRTQGWLGSLKHPSQAIAYLSVAELRSECQRLGIARNGGRDDLRKRLGAATGPLSLPETFRICHRPLFRRAERIWFHDPTRCRTDWILDATGQQRFPRYTPTERLAPFDSREEMLAFEQADASLALGSALEQLDWSLSTLVRHADAPTEPRLSVFRIARKLATTAATQLERKGRHAEASAVYATLLARRAYSKDRGHWAHRLILSLAASGQVQEAVAAAYLWRDRLPLSSRLAVERTGRRLARRQGLAWVPAVPLAEPRKRNLCLSLGAVDDTSVEESVRQHIEQTTGRRALHAEAPPWTTLFALLFYDLYWLPVPGALPAPGLSGPVDLGTPAFATARRVALARSLAAIAGGAGPRRVAIADRLYRGEALAGAHWNRFSPSDLVAVADGVGGAGLAMILGRMAHEGWSARRGLPDLIVLPGAVCRVEGAFPSRLSGDFHLVEVKGPGDALRDEQRAWFHHLTKTKVKAEVWKIRVGSA